MDTKQIIEKALEFLCLEHGLKYDYKSEHNGDMHFYYSNDYGCFEYYEWEQMQEQEFSVKYNLYFKKLELQHLYPKDFALFKQQHKGFKWFFKDKRKDHWDMIANILRKEIDATGSLFGLKLN